MAGSLPSEHSLELMRQLALDPEVVPASAEELARSIPTLVFPTVPSLVLEIARQHPNAIAIRQNDREYRYAELARAATQVAEGLSQRGLVIGDCVTVAGVSSFGLIAAAVGVLLAGGILVFLDDNLPEARRRQIVDVVGDAHTIEVAAHDRQDASGDRFVVEPWPDHADLVGIGTYSPPVLPPDASAYIFFTSGSSGVPKGVLGQHNGLAHFLAWQRAAFPLGPDDRLAQITALSFDVVLRDLFYPLTSGATIEIPEHRLLLDAPRFLEWIADRRITVLHCVPSLMKAWLFAAGDRRPFQHLRFLFFAGEPLTDLLVQRFRASADEKTKVVNLYGPTETTLAKLFNVIDTTAPGVQLIGRPQAGVQVTILDERGGLKPPGEVGEIAIRTPYRSHGYYRDQALTDQVFIPNPYGTAPGDLIYMTGDLGCATPDGQIRILGRKDSQIKIRGVRIEPNEIEAAIQAHDAIADVAVTTRLHPDGDGEKVLWACVVPRQSDAATRPADFEEQLREFLRHRLQNAMVPSHVAVVASLPHLPNGKIDRKAIAAFDLHESNHAVGVAELTDNADHQFTVLLVQLAKILGAPIRDLDRSFLELGGDSLSFVKASFLIEDYFGTLPEDWESLPLRSLRRETDAEVSRSQKRVGLFAGIQTAILIRAISILFIVLDHAGIEVLIATKALFVVSGMSFTRFLLPSVLKARSFSPSLRFILKFGIPAAMWQLLRALVKKSLWFPDLVLLGTLWQPPSGGHLTLWFLDILSACILLMTALAVAYSTLLKLYGSRCDREEPTLGFHYFVFAIAVALYVVQVGSGLWNGELGVQSVGPFRWFWIFVLGGIMQMSKTTMQKVGALLALLLMMVLQSRFEQQAYLTISLPLDILPECVLALVLSSKVLIPRLFRPAINIVAENTLYIYIINNAVVTAAPALGTYAYGRATVIVLALLAGVVFGRLWVFMLGVLRATLAKSRGGMHHSQDAMLVNPSS